MKLEQNKRVFIENRIRPISKRMHIVMIVFLWYFSLFICIFANDPIKLGAGIILADTILTAGAIFLWKKYGNSLFVQFLSRGIILVYLSFLFLMVSMLIWIAFVGWSFAMAIVMAVLFLLFLAAYWCWGKYKLMHYSRIKPIRLDASRKGAIGAMIGSVLLTIVLKDKTETFVFGVIALLGVVAAAIVAGGVIDLMCAWYLYEYDLTKEETLPQK